MKICLVGPGIIQIPPVGWGAVEILIWDYYNELIKQNHSVNIINKMRSNSQEQTDINSLYCKELISEINNGQYDFVHIHYDCLFHIIPYLKHKKIGFTSHYPYIDNIEKHKYDNYTNIFNFMINNDKYINFVLAEKDLCFLLKNGANVNNIHKLENGVNCDDFLFKPKGLYQDKTIYLGKISKRKGQNKYCKLNNIDIIGPGGNNLSNWKGEWTRDEVKTKLTNYGNMLLLSDGEADPLVIKEALVSGLGVVVNKSSSKNLEVNDFITVVEEDKLNDLEFIQLKIDENRSKSTSMRNVITNYGKNKYKWSSIMRDYITNINMFDINIHNNIHNNTTLVTAFFDINREHNGDGRKISEYLTWIQKTLQLNCNLYIITESKFVDFMKKNRPKKYKTFIKEDILENAEYYKYLPNITEILNSSQFKDKIKHPERVECKLPEYNVIQYSKFGWLKDAINNNPFHTEYFLWVDAGISRFFMDIDINKPYPNNNVIYNNKFLIENRYDIKNYKYCENDFIWDSTNLLSGGLFGGNKEIIIKISDLLCDVFVNKMLKNNNVNNEQLGLTIVYKNNPNLFNLIDGKKGINLWIFKYLSQ